MYLHSCTITIGTYRWIYLSDSKINRQYIRTIPDNSLGYASGDMLKQHGRHCHLLLDNAIQIGIVQSIAYIIGHNSPAEIITDTQVYHKISPYCPFLRHDAMERPETQIAQKYKTIHPRNR